ncbi:MAG TPA: RluA family pseudouridine synthase, partial [Myxococcota bacterium]|nr:RluA family pseudouridine synthase [Myxococcota bacterium]
VKETATDGTVQPSPPPEATHRVVVDEAHDGWRLDMCVAALVPGVSRSAAQRLIEGGRVTVAGRRRPQGFRVAAGVAIEASVPVAAPREAPRPQAGDLDILFEDDDLLAINKRPGVVVHPGAGHQSGTLVNQLAATGRTFSVIGGADRPGLVHRLDRDTSGVLLIAKSDAAHLALAAQFKDRVVSKTYLALVLGPQIPDRGAIASDFGRRPGDRKQFTGRVRSDRKALTEYETIARAGLCALVRVRPRTGRTHQIRVHLSENGHPIVGDRVYGRAYPRPGSRPEDEAAALRTITRHALHALAIRFRHPRTGEWMQVAAPLPRDFRQVLEAVFGSVPADLAGPAPDSGIDPP